MCTCIFLGKGSWLLLGFHKEETLNQTQLPFQTEFEHMLWQNVYIVRLKNY